MKQKYPEKQSKAKLYPTNALIFLSFSGIKQSVNVYPVCFWSRDNPFIKMKAYNHSKMLLLKCFRSFFCFIDLQYFECKWCKQDFHDIIVKHEVKQARFFFSPLFLGWYAWINLIRIVRGFLNVPKHLVAQMHEAERITRPKKEPVCRFTVVHFPLPGALYYIGGTDFKSIKLHNHNNYSITRSLTLLFNQAKLTVAMNFCTSFESDR